MIHNNNKGAKMKSIMFAFLIGLMMIATTAHAGFQGYQSGGSLGVFQGLDCRATGGLTCAKANGRFSIGLATAPYTGATLTRFSNEWIPSTLTSGTAAPGIASTVFVTQLNIPYSAVLTGITILNGTPCGTDKYVLILYNYAGVPLAQTAGAGTTCSGTSVYQAIPFTAPFTTTYSGTYWIGVQLNGTTDRYQALPAAAAISGLAGSVAGQVFGTASTIVVPATFTADKGPIAFTY